MTSDACLSGEHETSIDPDFLMQKIGRFKTREIDGAISALDASFDFEQEHDREDLRIVREWRRTLRVLRQWCQVLLGAFVFTMVASTATIIYGMIAEVDIIEPALVALVSSVGAMSTLLCSLLLRFARAY